MNLFSMIIGIDASLACRGERTGVESYTFQIITHLASVIPAHSEVRLYSDRAFPSDFAHLIPPHWKQIILSWPPRFLWTQVRLSFEMFVRPPDILFIPGHVEPFIHPKATVMMLHDVAAWRFPQAYSCFDRWYTLKCALRAYRSNPAMIVPALFTKQEFEKFACERHVEGRARIIPINHGYSNTTRVEEVQVLSRFGLIHNTPYIICIGRVEYKKNIDTIIHAFEKLKQTHHEFFNLKLILAGKPGHGYEDIAKLIRQSPYQKDIIETGWIPHLDAQTLLIHARALVFTSRYEGFGFPILEALALGVPVVTSKNLGLEDVGGDLALYVSHDRVDEIVYALEKCLHLDSHERARLREEGRKHVERFSWDVSAKATYDVLMRAYEIAGEKADMI